MKRAFGRLYSEDRRDKRFRLAKGIKLPQKKMWNDSKWSGDQKSMPHCVGFAWVHWLSCSPIRQYIHPAGVYALAQYIDEWPGEDYDGTSVRAGAKILHKLGFIKAYNWANNAETVVDAILSTGPVVVGTNWYSDMSRVDTDGYISATGSILGGHAYLLSGADRRKNRVRMKNSWGLNWGNNGHAWLSIADLDELIKDSGEACLGIEMKPVPSTV